MNDAEKIARDLDTLDDRASLAQQVGCPVVWVGKAYSIWHYSVTYPHGGGFGSSTASGAPQRAALGLATRNVTPPYYVVVERWDVHVGDWRTVRSYRVET